MLSFTGYLMQVVLSYVVAGEVVHVGLCEHGVVLELRLSQRWCVASLSNLSASIFLLRSYVLRTMITSLALPDRRLLRVDL